MKELLVIAVVLSLHKEIFSGDEIQSLPSVEK